MSALPQGFDPSDYERPARRGVRGTIVTRSAVMHVAVYAVGDQWRADAVVELAGGVQAQLPVSFNAPTPREAWAAVSAAVLRKLGNWLEGSP